MDLIRQRFANVQVAPSRASPRGHPGAFQFKMQKSTRLPARQEGKILVIVGPNASGKSALAIKLAKKLNGEIVSADSRQVYKGLDVGSGKLEVSKRGRIPHHLLDVVNPKRVFSVVQYQKLAYRAIDEIISRGKLPIIVGGTGQYIDTITRGQILPAVKHDSKLRARLANLTNDKLYKLLKQLDPKRAKTIDKHNPRRLVRAIEIAKAIGRTPILSYRKKYVATIIGIKPSIQELRFKIHERLRRRIKQGLVAEVHKLHNNGLSWKRMSDLGLEYRYISLYLRGKLSKQEMLKQLETAISQYAKRQMTWFKRDKSITWLPGNQINQGLSLVLRIRSRLRQGASGAP